MLVAIYYSQKQYKTTNHLSHLYISFRHLSLAAPQLDIPIISKCTYYVS